MRATSSLLVRVTLAVGCLWSLAAGPAYAQPSIRVSGPEPSVFEGDPSGPAVALNFTVRLSAVSAQTVTVLFSTFTFANNAVSSGSCATANQPGGADFIGVTNQLVTIPANANPPEVTVPVTVCRDDQVEFHQNFANQTREDLGVMLTAPVNAVCNGAECLNVGHIFDDDGTPFAAIGNVSVREPATGSRSATFTVGLSHPHPGFEVRVGYATRNGTARAVPGACGFLGPDGFPDFINRSGTLVFPSGVTSATLSVPVCADTLDENTETFFVDLTGQLNVTAGGPGTGSIVDASLPSMLGTFALEPEGLDVEAGEWATYQFTWTLSSGVWRDLHSMDLRVRQPGTEHVVLWVRWLETGNTFELCEGTAGAGEAAPRCGPAVVAGTDTVLKSPLAELDLARTSVVGSGPTGPSVTLNLAVRFARGAGNRTYDVEVAAENDGGLRDAFETAGVLGVGRPQPRQ